MTNKDYQALAIVLARSKPVYRGRILSSERYDQWKRDIQAVAYHCALDNPQAFNRERFIDACYKDGWRNE